MLVVDSIWSYVRSLSRAREFYGGILGLEPVFEDVDSGWLEFAAGSNGCRVACQEWGKTDETRGRSWVQPTPQNTPRLVLATGDLAQFLRQLAARGLAVGPPQRVGEVLFVHLLDPDGNALQVVEKPRS